MHSQICSRCVTSHRKRDNSPTHIRMAGLTAASNFPLVLLVEKSMPMKLDPVSLMFFVSFAKDHESVVSTFSVVQLATLLS